MYSLGSITAAALLVLPQVLAHGGVLSYSINGQWHWGWKPYNSPSGQTSIQRPWATFDPITDAGSGSISCNNDGSSSAAQLTATVAAGSKITAYWNQVWPHPQGPMLTYLANCGGSTCTGVNSRNLRWFKIDHSGLLSGTIGNGKWASGKMIDQNNTWTSTIPSTVPAGHYLIRFETIALHSLPAQFYPECAQIQITGGGSRAPTSSELVSFPGAYKNSDPGLSVNLYSSEAMNNSNYIIPGPPLYGGSSSGGGSGGGGSTPTTSSTQPQPSNPPPSTGTVNQYGQCGGVGWSGGTACVSPYTCKVVNDYYSQCQ